MKKRVTKKRKQKVIDDPSPSSDSSPYIPNELILQSIVTRLPTRKIFQFKSEDEDEDNVFDEDVDDTVLNEDEDEDNVLDEDEDTVLNENEDGDRLLSKSDPPGHSIEPVGNCNGLACVKRLNASAGFEEIFIINRVTRETLNLTCLTPEIGDGRGLLTYLCHGFGFDSLSKEYKIVLIYTTSAIDGVRGFICMVVTLGGRSWRKIVTSTCDISPPPGHSPFPSKMVTTMWRNDHRYSTTCGNDLLWMVTNTGSDDGNKNQMLLSFDVHNEKMQFIRLPLEYNPLISTFKRDGSLEIDYHLMEFKGYPCVARSERDKIKQTWIEEKTYNVSLKDGSVSPASQYRNPFMRYFSSTISDNQVSPPTRMFSFSDRVILYWFDGGCLIFYDLEMKHHNLVQGIESSDVRTGDVFEAKMVEIRPDPDISEDIDDSECDCPCIDYQLHVQAENIISLKTFTPKEGERPTVPDLDVCWGSYEVCVGSQHIRLQLKCRFVLERTVVLKHYMVL
ncbi:hypothetical protein C5167_023686 [Papaver somniferum]|uniref:F-box associated beta-propeller type 3 domain-containing protein n=1 Tax=Papaver somniferum TaxID=3469 RepID=A0A4Y7JPF6_PAPSO|nr:hypothetical protein C5167_023686 [Papaver somniferum]